MHSFAIIAFASSVLAGPVQPINLGSGGCSHGYYWDSGYGCTPLPPPNNCGHGQYWDSIYGCVNGHSPNRPPPPGCNNPNGCPPTCQAALSVVSEANQQDLATAFCSSYLSIPAVTHTVTTSVHGCAATATVTETTTKGDRTVTPCTATSTELKTKVTKTITDMSTFTSFTSTVETVDATSTSTVVCKPPPDMNSKRDGLPQALALERAFPQGCALSSACSCLSIQPTTTISTTTLGATDTVTTTKTIPCGVVTVCATSTTTSTTKTDSTTTSTVTSTCTTTSTKYVRTVSAYPTGSFQVAISRNGKNTGQFAQALVNDDPHDFTVYSGPMGATTFSLDPDGTFRVLEDDDPADTGREIGEASFISPSDPAHLYIVGSGSRQVTEENREKLTCTVTQKKDGSCPLMCSSERGSINFDKGVYWRVGSAQDASGENIFDPFIIGFPPAPPASLSPPPPPPAS